MMALVERERPLQQLVAALDLARQGSGRTALVCGEAGIGKTSLLKLLVSQAGSAHRLWGGCEALSSPRPLGPLHDMADGLNAGVRSLLGRDGQRPDLFAATLRQLQQALGPTIMVLEDLHWADAATLDLVKFLARRIERVPVLLVLSYRDDELGERHPLRGVLGDIPADALTRVPLLPLSENAVHALASQAARPSQGLHAATGGNPFFVTEVLRQDALPGSVRDAVLARAARQEQAVRALLDLVAIVPGQVELQIVDAIVAPGNATISAALSSGLLAADQRCYFFRHELARIAVEQALPAPLAAGLHAKVLATLEQRIGAVATARLVHHAAAAGDSAAVLKYVPQAAAEAVACGAHREAAALYATALAHAQTLAPAGHAALLEQRAYRCYLTDQIDEAIAAQEQALAIWRLLLQRPQEARASRWLSRLYWYGGRNAEAVLYADLAVHQMDGMPEGPELAWALSNRAQLYMLAGQTAEAVTRGERALALAERLGDLEIAAHALNNVGSALYQAGHAKGREMLERSLAIALAHGYPEHAARAYVNLASSAVNTLDFARASSVIDSAAAYFAERDLDSWSHYLLAWQCRLNFELGRWDAAAATAGGLVARPGVAPVSRLPALTVLSRVRRVRGDPGAQELLDEAALLAAATGELQRLWPVAVAYAEQHWIGGSSNAAPAVIRQAHQLAAERSDWRAQGELAVWGRRLGLDLAAPDNPAALTAAAPEAPWQTLADSWRALGCEYRRAFALLDGDATAMREALQIFQSLGARAVAERCRELLRQAGIQGIARGPRASTSANPAGLTARELQVLALLTERLSNAEIAARLVRSEKTIDHHISAILHKLKVRSRAEAVVAAAKLPPPA